MAAKEAKRISLRLPIWVAAGSFSACAILWLSWGVYLYWNDVRLVNFLAAWIPFVLSTLIAFVPEHKMSIRKKVLWRLSVMSVGLAWSVVLWHQQIVVDATARKDQQIMIASAVSQSTEHADKQLGSVKTDLGKRLDTLEEDLDTSIGKVRPKPPQFAQLQFSFYDQDKFPVQLISRRANASGSFNLEFWVRNISDEVAAENGDLWMVLCDECKYVSEPTGFTKLSESPESTRHRAFQIINHGVFLEPWKVSVSLPVKFSSFEIAFRYSCQTCGPGQKEVERLTVEVLPPFQFPNALPKPKVKARSKPF